MCRHTRDCLSTTKVPSTGKSSLFHRIKHETESTSGAVLLFSVDVRALKRSRELHLRTLQRALADFEARSGTCISEQRSSVMEEATGAGAGGAELEAILLDAHLYAERVEPETRAHENQQQSSRPKSRVTLVSREDWRGRSLEFYLGTWPAVLAARLDTFRRLIV